ncbi:MAG: OmpA family protein [Flavobacteriaceae bacterium]|nr:OmpA family protein [Flavobacteriaceae bacterium]
MKIKFTLIILFLIGLQTALFSMESPELLTQVTDSISPNKNLKNQLTPTEIKAVIIKDVNFDVNTCFQIMQGVIYNSGDHKPMHHVRMTLSLNNKVIKEIITDYTGGYQLKLLCNKTYDLKIKITGFEEKSITFKSDIKSNTIIKKDFQLDGAYCYQTISGTIKSSLNGQYIAGASVSLLKNNKKIKTVTTLEDGIYSFSLDCYKTYTIEVVKEHFKSNTVLFNTSLVPQMTLIKHLTLKSVKCTKTIYGMVRSESSNTPLKEVNVELSKDGEFIKTIQTNAAGKFTFDLSCNSVFTVSLQKENYKKIMRAIETDSNDKKAGAFEFQLKRLGCTQLLEGIVKNSYTNKVESGVILQFFTSEKLIKTITTGADGTFTFNTDCKKSYKVTTSKKFYTDGSQYFVSGIKNNSKIHKTIKVSPILDFVQVREILMLKVNPNNLTFVLNKNTLTPALLKELYKITALMEKHPYIRLEINIHTDSRANDSFNMSLSKQRAKTIIEYLINNGISSDRLTGDGYGETQLLNHCSNGVKCKNYEHLKNKRVEFIVLDE